MHSSRRLWLGLAAVFFLSFAALGWIGREIYLAAPPILAAVQAQDGRTLYTAEQIRDGQRAWRAAGGKQLGTVWGHGSYVAPDWSAEWLHREALAYRESLSLNRYGRDYQTLAPEPRAAIDAQLKAEMRGQNAGLAMMVFLSLLPAGIYQAWHCIATGLWYARSPEIVHSKLMEALVWLRVPGDVVFALGALLLALYAARLLMRPRRRALAPQAA